MESIDIDKPEEATDLINAWCAIATKNHLTNIVSREDTAELNILLLNAIHFDGVWRHSFPETQTTIMDFSADQNEITIFPFITQIAEYFYVESAELDSKILRLPYKVSIMNFLLLLTTSLFHIWCSLFIYGQGGKFAMYIVLPRKADGLIQLFRKLNSSTWFRAIKFMVEVKVKVALPKIRINDTLRLKDTMKEVSQICRSSYSSVIERFNGILLNIRWESSKFLPIEHL